MEALLRIAGLCDRIARNAGKLFGWLVVPLIFVIMFDVITRKLDVTRLYFSQFTQEYGLSISTILQDFQWHLHGALLMMTFGFGYLANAHVRVDIFREMLSRRAQGWAELLGLIVLAIPFLTLMILYSWDLVALSFSQGEGSESLTGIPQRWIIKSFMVIGFVVVSLAVTATIIRLLAFLFGDPVDSKEALEGLEIFSDEHNALEEARLAAERALMEEQDHLEGR